MTPKEKQILKENRDRELNIIQDEIRITKMRRDTGAYESYPLDMERTIVYHKPMTDKQAKILKIYDELTITRKVPPSYQVVADRVPCSKANAYKVIQEHLRQKEVFKLK